MSTSHLAHEGWMRSQAADAAWERDKESAIAASKGWWTGPAQEIAYRSGFHAGHSAGDDQAEERERVIFRLRSALERIRDYDESDTGYDAPVDEMMRAIAREALEAPVPPDEDY